MPPRLSGGTDCTLLQLDNPVAEDEAESRSFTGSFVNFNFELGIPPVVMSITGDELNRERSTRGDLLSMTAQKRRRIFGRPNTRQAPKLKREDAAQVRVAGDVQAPRLKREDVTEDAAQTRAVVDHPLHGTPAVTGTRSPHQLGESELARLRRLLQDQEKQHLEEMRALAERSALANKQVRIGLEAQIKEKERKCQEQEAKIENLEAKICKLEDCGARLTRQAEVHDLHLHGHERACSFSICCRQMSRCNCAFCLFARRRLTALRLASAPNVSVEQQAEADCHRGRASRGPLRGRRARGGRLQIFKAR